MKYALAVLMLVLAAPAFAADPDFWGLDGRQEVTLRHDRSPGVQEPVQVTAPSLDRVSRDRIFPTEEWTQQDDGWSDGMMRFSDLGLVLYWIFGHWTKVHW